MQLLLAFTTQLRNKSRLKHLRKKKGLTVTGQQVFPTRHAFEVNALFGGVAEHVDISLKEPKAKYTFMEGNYIQYNPTSKVSKQDFIYTAPFKIKCFTIKRQNIKLKVNQAQV